MEYSEPQHPGELVEAMLLQGQSQSELARKMSVSRQLISMVVNGHRSLTPRLAMQLGHLTGKDTEFWMSVQRRWDAHENLKKPGPKNHVESIAAIAADTVVTWQISGSRLLVDSDIQFAFDAGEMGIEPFDRSRLGNASYDLTLEEMLTLSDGRLDADEKHSKMFLLKPGELYTGCTRERITLSNQMLAKLGQTTDLIERGIIVHLGLQIDPGYDGRIFFTLENRTRNDAHMIVGESVISIEFHHLAKRTAFAKKERAGTKGGAFDRLKARWS